MLDTPAQHITERRNAAPCGRGTTDARHQANHRESIANRVRFAERGVLVVDVVSNPGAGRTSLLRETARVMGVDRRVAILGDGSTALDALDVRLLVDGLKLGAGSIALVDSGAALDRLAQRDPGASRRVVLWSVDEGVSLPQAHPAAFREANLVVLSKLDGLRPGSSVPQECRDNIRRVNAALDVIGISLQTSAGVNDWLAWLELQAEVAASMAAATAAAN